MRCVPERPRMSLGIITPSGNVVVEWTAMQLVQASARIGAHFSRIRVAGSVDPFPDSYDWQSVLAAASLIGDARPGAMVWAGSKGVLVGLETERELRARIEEAAGVPATSSTLALEALAARTGISRIGLVTPYSDAYQARLVAGFTRMGLEVVAERHAGLTDNLSYADLSPVRIRVMAAEVAREANGRAQVLLAWCTNLACAPLAEDIERDAGLPFLDATALALHHALTLLGADIPEVPGWGHLFSRAVSREATCVC